MQNQKFEELKQKRDNFDKLKTFYTEINRLKKIDLTALDDEGIKKYNDEVNSILNKVKQILTLSDNDSMDEVLSKIMQEGKKLKEEIKQEIPVVLSELNNQKSEVETKLETKPDNINQLRSEIANINTIIQLVKGYEKEFNPQPTVPQQEVNSKPSQTQKTVNSKPKPTSQRVNKGYGTQSTYKVKHTNKLHIEDVLDLPLTQEEIKNIEVDTTRITLKSFNDIVKEWESNISKGLLLEELTVENYKTYLKLKIAEELFEKEIKSLEREISKNSRINNYEENKKFLLETYNKLGIKFEDLKTNVSIAHQMMKNISQMYDAVLTILNQVTGRNKEDFKFGIGGKVVKADVIATLYEVTASKLEINTEKIDKLNYLLLDLRKTKTMEYERDTKKLDRKEGLIISQIRNILYELGPSMTNQEYERIKEFAEINGVGEEVDIQGIEIINQLTKRARNIDNDVDYNSISEEEIENYEEEREMKDVFEE